MRRSLPPAAGRSMAMLSRPEADVTRGRAAPLVAPSAAEERASLAAAATEPESAPDE